MAIYRFRVTFEDHEEVYREIEIKSTQSLEDFHTIIIQSIGFDNLHNASFYSSDSLWHKGDEFVLYPPSESEIAHRKKQELLPKKQMSKCKLAALIDDPHQRFIYVYDPKSNWTFFVELIKIVLNDPQGTFPVCTKAVGTAPKQDLTKNIIPIVDEKNDDDEFHPDEEAYVNAHVEDKIILLEEEMEIEIEDTDIEQLEEYEAEEDIEEEEDQIEKDTDEV